MAQATTAPVVAKRRWALIASVATVVVVVDLVTKGLAVDRLAGEAPLELVWTARLRYVENRGSAFSLVEGGGWGPLLSLAALAVVGLLLWQSRGVASRAASMGVGLVLGGAVGNLIDRVARADAGFLSGPVIDFVDLQWWPVFNVADSAVVVGAIMLVVFGFRDGDASAAVVPDVAP
jgi:signal peptidase II